ncbi:hypothetical protein [Barrientosiimonas endolithica]|uniref:Uncharacterized protein n=1 Tax=Barrientosiimonas endolithica TaxID=1535208 RepID=A0ABM8HBJ6_9MICO|nr:hypothetical protein [Barrientosiimonas endolithica]BDZ58330.1 hypothetical protein GCM10025872_19870 [Barrientosiimonas endolithica]
MSVPDSAPGAKQSTREVAQAAAAPSSDAAPVGDHNAPAAAQPLESGSGTADRDDAASTAAPTPAAPAATTPASAADTASTEGTRSGADDASVDAAGTTGDARSADSTS